MELMSFLDLSIASKSKQPSRNKKIFGSMFIRSKITNQTQRENEFAKICFQCLCNVSLNLESGM